MTESDLISAKFQEVLQKSEQITGAHTEVSTCIFVFLSTVLPSRSRCLEIGVWNGKSACALAHLFSSLDLVDVAIPSALDTIKEVDGVDVSFFQAWSGEWLSQARDTRAHSYDFIHMDTSHSFKDTICELEGCSSLARDHAILVLDDWNEIYPTVQAGYFYYKYVLSGEFEIFLTAYNKAYLCKKDMFSHYIQALEPMRAFMALQGYKTHIARTSNVGEYRAFLIRPVTANVDEYYGGRSNPLYSDLYQDGMQSAFPGGPE